MCSHNGGRHVEIIETPSSNPDSSFVYTEKVYICDLCDEIIEDEDPVADAHDALVDSQIDMARDKEP